MSKLKSVYCFSLPIACLCLCSAIGLVFTGCSDSLVVSSFVGSSVEKTSVAESLSGLPRYQSNGYDSDSGDVERFFIWTDPETGVQYIVYREKCYYAGFGGITPRLNPDGSLFVENDDLK